ncbi:MAG: glutamine synthetase family protein [Candidatus Thorarchaeota archaeon]
MSKKLQHPEFLRLVFADVLGRTRGLEMGFDRLSEVVNEGVYIDGSSVPGYAAVNSSDLLLSPISSMPLVLPWDPEAGVLLCSVYEVSGVPHPSDSRHILRRVVERMYDAGMMLQVGSELEFFLVKNSRDRWPTPGDLGGYMSGPPDDAGLAFRRSAIRALNRIGISTTTHHHEVADGQHEIGIRHGPVSEIADSVMLAKLTISEIAHSRGLFATFMAKPFAGINGNGMHMHQSLWTIDERTNLFATDEPGEISGLAKHYVAGILKHAPALSAIVAPTVNSFKRLIPGYEAPTRIAWGPRNRTTMVRIPHFNGSSDSARIEIRCPDPLCSPHLAMAATLAAGMDGVEKCLEPADPTTHDLYEDDHAVPSLPGSLIEAIKELAKDRVLRDALGKRVIDSIIELRTSEWKSYLESAGEHDENVITSWERQRYLLAN